MARRVRDVTASSSPTQQYRASAPPVGSPEPKPHVVNTHPSSVLVLQVDSPLRTSPGHVFHPCVRNGNAWSDLVLNADGVQFAAPRAGRHVTVIEDTLPVDHWILTELQTQGYDIRWQSKRSTLEDILEKLYAEPGPFDTPGEIVDAFHDWDRERGPTDTKAVPRLVFNEAHLRGYETYTTSGVTAVFEWLAATHPGWLPHPVSATACASPATAQSVLDI